MMRRLLLGLCAVAVLGSAVAWSGSKASRRDFDFRKEERNPVSHFRLNNDPADFQFAIVSDRTGGHRARIFSRAVEKLNLLQPEFVISVGDLIEGYTTDTDRLGREWREFQSYVSQLRMPFFYVPGNHDLANPTEQTLWKEKFGRRYYDFVFRNVLFLVLCSEDFTGKEKDEGAISAEQQAFVQKSLEAHRDVRWTLVFLHKPMWVYPEVAKSGWLEVEKLLAGRPYTVFAGHIHRYQRFVRNGQRYYQLATTGGGSRMRGIDYGEFDHLVWVTMKKDGPVLANVLLDGVLPADLKPIETAEEGAPEYNRKPTQPVSGKVFFEGKSVAGAVVTLHSTAKESRPPRSDGRTDATGSFTLSTYTANDGAPSGEYHVTIVLRKPLLDDAGKPGRNVLPEKYAKVETTPLTVVIKTGATNLQLKLDE
jgi:3',5'-cyclic AMP phosphodiesterase CpdA